MFSPSSRYASLTPYHVRDRRDRYVSVVPVPLAPAERLLGYHVLRQGQRLDHLAYKYLSDATMFWRICELNDVMQAEQLTEVTEVAIPTQVN
jgi:hypothetical protein